MSSSVTAADIALKSVLIAFDFSEASRKPLHHALAIARHYGAKFYLAHVVSGIGYTIAGQEALSLAAERTGRTAQQLEQELLESEALAGLHHEFIILEGDVWEQLEILIRQKQVDMVVVGTHGRGALGKLLLGSVAEQIFRHADCLVATVGPGSYEDSLVEKIKRFAPFCFLRISGRLLCMLCPTRSLSPVVSEQNSLFSMFSRWPRCRRVFIGQPPATSPKSEMRREWLANGSSRN